MTYFRAKAVVAAALSALVLQLAVGVAAAQDKLGEITKRLIGDMAPRCLHRREGPADTWTAADGTHDAAGNMAAQIMPDRDRPKFGFREATPEQAKDVLSDYTAYFGTYSIDTDARIIRHYRKGNINPGQMGELVRRFEFAEGGRLILRPAESNNRLIWERAD